MTLFTPLARPTPPAPSGPTPPPLPLRLLRPLLTPLVPSAVSAPPFHPGTRLRSGLWLPPSPSLLSPTDGGLSFASHPPPTSGLPASLPQRLRAALPVWRAITPPGDSHLLSWIEFGYQPPLAVPIGSVPSFNNKSRPITNRAHLTFVNSEITRLVALGAIRQVPPCQATHSASARVVTRPHSSKLRLVIDYRPLNDWINTPHVRFEGLKQAAELLSTGCWMTSHDCQDAYLHLAVDPTYHQLLGFNINGNHYQATALPFGLSSSPHAWHSLMAVFIRFMRTTFGLRVCWLLDDVLVISNTREEALRHRELLVHWMARLGITRSLTKGNFEPTQHLTFLGLDINTSATPVFSVPPQTLADVRQFALSVTNVSNRANGLVPARLLASFSGKAMSLSLAVLQARLRTRTFYNDLAASASASHLPLRRRWNRWVRLSTASLEELQWWSRLSPTACTRTARPVSMTSALRLFTDSSTGGWAATLDLPSPPPPTASAPTSASTATSAQQRLDIKSTAPWQVVNGPWLATLRKHWQIAAKELAAVILGVQHFLPSLADNRLLIITDNKAVFHLVRSGCSRQPLLFNLLRQLWTLLVDNNITFSSRWVPTAINPADSPSRVYDRHNWSLSHAAFSTIVSHFGTPTVDLFASADNHLVPDYCSFNADPQALAQDAFTTNWSQFQLPFANGPFSLVSRILRHGLECRTPRLLLVVPYWPSRPWWPLLRQLAIDCLPLPANCCVPTPLAHRRLAPEPWVNWDVRLMAVLVDCSRPPPPHLPYRL